MIIEPKRLNERNVPYISQRSTKDLALNSQEALKVLPQLVKGAGQQALILWMICVRSGMQFVLDLLLVFAQGVGIGCPLITPADEASNGVVQEGCHHANWKNANC